MHHEARITNTEQMHILKDLESVEQQQLFYNK